MTRYCPYCGKQIKDSDKFCIFCGKPLLSNIPNKKKDAPQKEEPEEEEPIEEEEPVKEKKKEKKKTEEDEEEDLEEEPVVLPDEVKEQINLKLKLTDLEDKKGRLDDKLKDLLKLVKSDEYELDFNFAEDVNLQMKAAKALFEEMKQKEAEILKIMEKPFIIEKLDLEIEKKKTNLRNLVREYKLKKLKDKDVVEKLKKKYKKQLKQAKKDKQDLILGIDNWIDELREERNEIWTEKKFDKARESAGEISEEDYKQKEADYDRKIAKIEAKIKTLKKLMK